MTTTETAPDGSDQDDQGEPGADPVHERPVIFISHKHMDEEIASRLQDELEELLGDAVRIHNTSDARGEGPTEGDSLGGSLRTILHETSLVILLYTVDEEDWRWCFYECGVANDPVGDVPTETVVFDFGTERGSGVFTGDKHLEVTPLDRDGNRRREAPADFRRFIRDLVTTDTYIDLPQTHRRDDLDDSELFTVADDFYNDLLEVGPAMQLELAEEMAQALKSVPAMYRRESFSPLFQDAARALGWGLDPRHGVRDIFLQYWNKRFLAGLKTLASRQLVFRPGRVHVEWSKLLRLCQGRIEEHGDRVGRLGRPVLAFVSDESQAVTGQDSIHPLAFWQTAQERWSDAWWYEDPVRQLSDWLRQQQGIAADGPLVERIFVLDRTSFDRPLAEGLADLATWMGEAGIATAVTFRNYRSDDDLHDFADFGLIMDLAATRFEVEEVARDSVGKRGPSHLDPMRYRSLKADFATKEVKRAERAWDDLQDHVLWRWRGTGTCDPEDLYTGVAGDD